MVVEFVYLTNGEWRTENLKIDAGIGGFASNSIQSLPFSSVDLAASRRLDAIGTTREAVYTQSRVSAADFHRVCTVHTDTCVHRARVWLFASQRYHRWCIPVIENELANDFDCSLDFGTDDGRVWILFRYPMLSSRLTRFTSVLI